MGRRVVSVWREGSAILNPRPSPSAAMRQVVSTAHWRTAWNLTSTFLLVHLLETVASKVCTSACLRQPNPEEHVAPGLLGSECLCLHNGTVSGTGLRGVVFRKVGGQDPPVRTVPLLGKKGSPLSAQCHLEDAPAA